MGRKRRKEEEKLERFSAKFLFFFSEKKTKRENIYPTHTHTQPSLLTCLPPTPDNPIYLYISLPPRLNP
jgi:hypothetical protein